MSPQTILYLIIAIIIAIGISLYFYAYKNFTLPKSLKWILGIIRTFVIFILLVLLINPKIKIDQISLIKPQLNILLDASASVSFLEEENEVRSIYNTLNNNEDLKQKFNLQFFEFGETLRPIDSLLFKDKQTQIYKALSSLKKINKNTISPTILVSDGNQTLGNSYEYLGNAYNNAIYPIVIGDTTTYADLKINRLNVNKYAFLKNEFPVEVLLSAQVEDMVNTQFTIKQGNVTVYEENIQFSKNNNSKTINCLLKANAIGLQQYTATITPIAEEKNTRNNTQIFAVEVIDQATNIAIVSSLIHPDLGALKKSIETNEQRKVTILKPQEIVSKLNDYQLLILYQPDRTFLPLYNQLASINLNTLTFTGTKTDWNFLNSTSTAFNKEISSATENVGAKLRLTYENYAVEDFEITNYPPLSTNFGALVITTPHQVLLEQTINDFNTNAAMIASWEIQGKKEAIWDAEGIWRWRAHSFLKNEDFYEFDVFLGKLIQYLASNKQRSRLEVSYNPFYYNYTPVIISAQYFDKNYVFDSRAQLEIKCINKTTNTTVTYPLLLKNNEYVADVSALAPGDYSFSVSVPTEGISRTGNFSLLDFNIEHQFLNANTQALSKLAEATYAQLYYKNDVNSLINKLLQNESYVTVQKNDQKIVPLVNWKILLFLLALLLAIEWFTRKYNGLV